MVGQASCVYLLNTKRKKAEAVGGCQQIKRVCIPRGCLWKKDNFRILGCTWPFRPASLRHAMGAIRHRSHVMFRSWSGHLGGPSGVDKDGLDVTQADVLIYVRVLPDNLQARAVPVPL